jgi:hypothetical protein
MATITTRGSKSSEPTHAEMDANLTGLSERAAFAQHYEPEPIRAVTGPGEESPGGVRSG